MNSLFKLYAFHRPINEVQQDAETIDLARERVREKGSRNMSTIQDCSAEQLAKLFHHYREALAHSCEGSGHVDEPSSWSSTSPQERKMTVAAIRLALLELATTPVPPKRDRRYFATPGEADWGC